MVLFDWFLIAVTILLKNTKFLILIVALSLAILQISENIVLVEKSNFNASQNFTTSETTDILSEWLWHNNTRCNSYSHDLPHLNNSFVGRSEEMMKVIQLMNAAHIVSINGAPGFGKSQLAIHVGYEMVSRDTNVRYIDAVDKLSYLKAFDTESLKSADISHKLKTRKQNKINKRSTSKNLSKKSSSLLAPSVYTRLS